MKLFARTAAARGIALALASFLLLAASAAQPGVDLAGMDRAVAPGDDFFALRERRRG